MGKQGRVKEDRGAWRRRLTTNSGNTEKSADSGRGWFGDSQFEMSLVTASSEAGSKPTLNSFS